MAGRFSQPAPLSKLWRCVRELAMFGASRSEPAITNLLGPKRTNLHTRIVFTLLSLAIISGGCGPTPDLQPAQPSAQAISRQATGTNLWVASDDGKLALRLTAISHWVAANESIHLAAEIRNDSQQPVTILRPFGDHYAARAVGMKIWDGNGQLRYTGPALTYVIGADAFKVIGPGEVVKDTLELTIDNFAGMAPRGPYALRYDYFYDGHWDTTAAAGNSGVKEAWRGTISSREIQMVRE